MEKFKLYDKNDDIIDLLKESKYIVNSDFFSNLSDNDLKILTELSEEKQIIFKKTYNIKPIIIIGFINNKDILIKSNLDEIGKYIKKKKSDINKVKFSKVHLIKNFNFNFDKIIINKGKKAFELSNQEINIYFLINA